jgi:hypothetical protein
MKKTVGIADSLGQAAKSRWELARGAIGKLLAEVGAKEDVLTKAMYINLLRPENVDQEVECIKATVESGESWAFLVLRAGGDGSRRLLAFPANHVTMKSVYTAPYL